MLKYILTNKYVKEKISLLFTNKYFAENMCSPNTSIIGLITSFFMTKANKISGEHLASSMNIISNDIVLELGPGSGWGLLKASTYHPKRLIAIEISSRFRNELSQLPIKLDVYGNDAKDMSSFLEANSVDKIYGMNVVYFLHPLEEYTKELYRIMHKNSIGILYTSIYI